MRIWIRYQDYAYTLAQVEGNSSWSNSFNWFVAYLSLSAPRGKAY